jgi:hypothetical protein
MRLDEKVTFELVAASAGEAQSAALVEMYKPGRLFHVTVEDLGPHSHEDGKNDYRVTLRPHWRGFDGS